MVFPIPANSVRERILRRETRPTRSRGVTTLPNRRRNLQTSGGNRTMTKAVSTSRCTRTPKERATKVRRLLITKIHLAATEERESKPFRPRTGTACGVAPVGGMVKLRTVRTAERTPRRRGRTGRHPQASGGAVRSPNRGKRTIPRKGMPRAGRRHRPGMRRNRGEQAMSGLGAARIETMFVREWKKLLRRINGAFPATNYSGNTSFSVCFSIAASSSAPSRRTKAEM